MVSGGETWSAPELHQRLIDRREKLRKLWSQLEEKHLARRRRNLQAIDAVAAKRLASAYIKRSDQLRPKPKSREDAARCAQYEGEIAMITAALRGLASPATFAQSIVKARAGTHLYLSRDEVTNYRRGLERQFVALSTWLPTEQRPANRARRVVNTSKRPVGWRVRSAGFEATLQRAASAPEPEFQAKARADAPERVRTAMLRRQILAVAERDLDLCETNRVREEVQLGVIVRAQMLKILHHLSEKATCYDDMRKAILEIPHQSRFRISKNQDEATFQSLLNDTLRQLKVDVDAVLAGKSPRRTIRATQPGTDRARRRTMARIRGDFLASAVGA